MPPTHEPESSAAPRGGMRYYVIGSAIDLLCRFVMSDGFSFHAGNKIVPSPKKRPRLSTLRRSRPFNPWAATASKSSPSTPIPGYRPRRFSLALLQRLQRKSVSLKPPSNVNVWPSYERCVSVSPHKTTTYTLTATDAAAHTKSAQATIEVH